DPFYIVKVPTSGKPAALAVIPNTTLGATTAQLAVDGAGTLYAYVPIQNQTYVVHSDGTLTSVPMTPPSGSWQYPGGIAADAAGDLFFPRPLMEVDPAGLSARF